MMDNAVLDSIDYLIKTYDLEGIQVNAAETHLVRHLAIEIDDLNKKMDSLLTKLEAIEQGLHKVDGRTVGDIMLG